MPSNYLHCRFKLIAYYRPTFWYLDLGLLFSSWCVQYLSPSHFTSVHVSLFWGFQFRFLYLCGLFDLLPCCCMIKNVMLKKNYVKSPIINACTDFFYMLNTYFRSCMFTAVKPERVKVKFG